MRIAGTVERPPKLQFTVDGQIVAAHPGESVAAALFAAGIRSLRLSPGKGRPRGMFCLMGVCQECLVSIDGKPRLACQETVKSGMSVATRG